ncbi:Putative succinate dehydrogenase assembly factor 4 [Septoria linicola]|uniref:Succinate dehydrogenase assembly factor 4, mitochondrial n=1 Tax=Septoria linicola TaxID=215465 RepID=A0A9Q9AME7_9PEZI|nr:Putative succinate dehydrogenase assembly factor 4 [Septoria linicola]
MQSTTRTMRTMRPGFFTRAFATRTPARSKWPTGPAPPRLPKEEQEIFERLQQQSTGAFSQPKAEPIEPTKTEQLEDAGINTSTTRSSEADKMLEQLRARAQVSAKGDGEELHPNIRRGAAPEFQGETNPKTGEVGGPKNDPLRWQGDWSYNGRVTDF